MCEIERSCFYEKWIPNFSGDCPLKGKLDDIFSSEILSSNKFSLSFCVLWRSLTRRTIKSVQSQQYVRCYLQIQHYENISKNNQVLNWICLRHVLLTVFFLFLPDLLMNPLAALYFQGKALPGETDVGALLKDFFSCC